jgi:L-ascorbate metabolism protein UlaG (beta-lactamase superfamily)
MNAIAQERTRTYVQLAGRRILIDPVLSDHAAPFSGMVMAFEGTTIYRVEDLPEIDYLLITHDHYDHLDRDTIEGLIPKTRWAIAGLGIGAHLEHWGFPADRIREGDWFDVVRLEPGLAVHVLPARHYSGRALKRNQGLWVGYALETNRRRLFFSGDSGFGPHIAEIAKRFDWFDVAVLDAGQYDPRWAFIHMNRKRRRALPRCCAPGRFCRPTQADSRWPAMRGTNLLSGRLRLRWENRIGY